jgi:glycine dehydrogenase subunit 1
MPFIPHNKEEIREMLSTIGVETIDDLFDEIPAGLRIQALDGIPESMSEMGISRLMQERADQDGHPLNFIGAGAYEHHIPAVVWQLATRGEFYSAYTPYQAEASQGTLQLIYEYQTMMTGLTAMEVSNASLYDGASALAEAVLMAVRAQRRSRSRRILLPQTLHPAYRATVHSIVSLQDIELVSLAFDEAKGRINLDGLKAFEGQDIAALVIPQPNFFGVLEEVDELTEWGQRNNVIVIAVVNPITLALLKPPGEWGNGGVDIVCGEGQPLGAPLSSGGPYFGFMCCKRKHVRQLPGRLVGRTIDADGKSGFVLTLQAREQHIRRSRATSNICTNQGLVVTAATIHMALLGFEGLQRVAAASYHNTHQLAEMVQSIPGVEPGFSGEFFHEFVLRLNVPVKPIMEMMVQHGMAAGYALKNDYPGLENALLVCATETKTDQDLQDYTDLLGKVLKAS